MFGKGLEHEEIHGELFQIRRSNLNMGPLVPWMAALVEAKTWEWQSEDLGMQGHHRALSVSPAIVETSTYFDTSITPGITLQLSINKEYLLKE